MTRTLPPLPDLKDARISVLMGGMSSERDVSLVSGQAVLSTLTEGGYAAQAIDVGPDVSALIDALKSQRPHVVFNALHGRYGEDGSIQGLLDLMGLPYTHSGVLASALAMDKAAAKSRFTAAGLTVAPHVVTTRADACTRDLLPRPYVIKPVADGSSVGVDIMLEGHNDRPEIGDMPNEMVMVEAFIPGRELTVAVVGDRALAVTEITTARGFYDYEAKYANGGSAHILPADLPTDITAKALAQAVNAHQALGCRGVTRTDFRLDDNRLVVLELNTQPGMTPTSLVPEQAAHVGISFLDLVLTMLGDASCAP